MDIQLPFGLRNGKIIHISEIAEEEKGLKCLCQCPECGSTLIAKLGDKRAKHFSHRNTNCTNALETSLHYFAKEVLQKHKKVHLPDLKVFYSLNFTNYSDFEINNEYGFGVGGQQIIVVKEGLVKFDRVECEREMNDIKPDIIGYIGKTPLYIEIAVTHYIDKFKYTKIKTGGVSTVEIDLKLDNIDYQNFDREQLEKLIIEATHIKKWIFNRKAEIAKKEIIEQNKKYIADEEKKRNIERLRLEELTKRIQINTEKEKKRLGDKLQVLIQLNKAENYNKKLQEFESTIHSNRHWINISKSLNINLMTIPRFLNIKVLGELAINCDRRIWQSMVFEKFILGRDNYIFSISDVVNWIKNSSGLSLNKDLVYTKDIYYPEIPDLTDAIANYFIRLVGRGILENHGYYKMGKGKYYQQHRVRIGDFEKIKELEK